MKNNILKNSLIAGTFALMLSACATVTPYKAAPEGVNGFGYKDTKIETGKHRVSFRGNSNTDRATVENYILLRAAELTLQDGFGHFVILDEDEGGERSFSSTGFNNGFGGRGFGRGFGGRGGFGGTVSTRTRERRQFDISVIVQGFPGQKSPENFEAFNAAEVAANLGGGAR